MELKRKLESWRGIIYEAKRNNYLLTYVPNKRLLELLDYFREPNELKLQKLMPIFHLISRDILEDELRNFRGIMN